MLWLSLHFPTLPIDVFCSPSEQPLVVEVTERQRRTILFANAAAQNAGVSAGMSITNAYALCQTLSVKMRADKMEHDFLQRIAILTYQFTPHIVIHPPNNVLLEVETSLSLFGGCDALLNRLHIMLRDVGAQYAIACFPTAYGAMVLARASVPLNSAKIFPVESLQDCPLERTDLPDKQIERMLGMGMKTLKDLFLLPGAALGRRFGSATLLYLQQLRGQHPESRPHYNLPITFQSKIELGHETSQQEALLFPLKRLLIAQENYLRARQLLVMSVALSLQRRDLSVETITVSPAHGLFTYAEWFELFRLRLEKHTLTQPIVGIGVDALEFSSWTPVAKDLFSNSKPTDITLAALTNRIEARIGGGNLFCVLPVHDHRPEKAWKKALPGEKSSMDFPVKMRPWWLLSTPKPLVSKKGVPCEGSPLTLLKGPDRLTMGWHDQNSVERDYFVAQHKSGAIYWIFRTVQEPPQWFLHGIFS